MNRFSIKCPDCTYPLDPRFYNPESGHQDCPSCSSKLTVYAVPALYRAKAKLDDAQAAQLEDAACFYHADKKAEHLCDDCGRFLCNLCTLPIDDEILCASCLELRRKDGSGRPTLKPRQIRYDKLALSLAILPMIFFYPLVFFTFATAPAIVFIVIRNWKKKPDFAPNMHVRMAVAFIIALLQMVGWVVFITMIVRRISSGG